MSSDGSTSSSGSEPAAPPPVSAATDLMGQARTLVASKSFAPAIELYKQVVALDDSSHAARHNIAVCHLHLRQYPLALETVNRALQKGGDKVAKYYATKATALLHMPGNRQEEAAECVRQGLAIDKDLPSLLTHDALKPRSSAPSSSSSSGSSTSSSTSSTSSTSSSSSSASSSVHRGTYGAIDFPRGTPAKPEPLDAPLTALTRTLAIARPLSLALLLAYFLPLSPALTAASWRFFLLATALCNALVLLHRHILPHLPAASTLTSLAGMQAAATVAAQRATGCLTDLGLPSIALPPMLLLYSPRPSALALLVAAPAAALNLHYALEAACGLPGVGPLLASTLAPRLTRALVPGAEGVQGEERRKRLVQGLVALGARAEVWGFLALLAVALTPLRNLGLTVSVGTLLYSKYAFNEHSRGAWRELDEGLRAQLARGWVPGALARGYDAAAAFAFARATASLVAAQQRSQGASSAAAPSSCSVQ